MNRWQHPGGRLRSPDLEEGEPGPVPEPGGFAPLVGPGPFTSWWRSGPDRVEIFTFRRTLVSMGCRGSDIDAIAGNLRCVPSYRTELLTRHGWVRVADCERWPEPTEVLTPEEATRRLGIPDLEPGVHVRSGNYDACWRCGLDGLYAHTFPELACPGWTDYGIWSRCPG